MAERSAGILAFRRRGLTLELLLVHPGGPFWTKKDDGAWSIPKGLMDGGEDALAAARREFEEETGFHPEEPFLDLGSFKQPSAKTISVWATEADFDLTGFRSNTFSMEWPPKSGRIAEFPEADRAGWFSSSEAVGKVTRGQVAIIEALLARVQP